MAECRNGRRPTKKTAPAFDRKKDRSFERGHGSQPVTPFCDQGLQPKFVCVHCLKEFKQRRDLLLHNNTYHMDYRHVCVLCWTTYKTHESLIIHNYRYHSNLNLFESLNKTDIKLNSQNNTYHCDKCLYQTNSPHILSLHIKTHSDRKEHNYNKVKNIVNVLQFPNREINVRTGIELFKCAACSFNTNCYSVYLQHISKHSCQPPNAPNDSGHPITRPRSKSSDSEQVNASPNHNGMLKKNKTAKCPAKPKNVTSQMSAHNPNVKNRKKRSRKGHKGQRKGQSQPKHFEHDLLECPFCKYRSSDLWLLKRHVMIHTGEKPLKCAHCSYASIWHSNLAKHVKSHHSAMADDKPIKAVNTRQSDVRKTRMNLRSGKEPTGCPHCNFSTANYLLLNRHLSMHCAKKANSTNRTLRQNVPKQKLPHWSPGNEQLDVNENLNNKTLVCAQCKSQTSRGDILTEHIMNVDSEKNSYKCNRCIDGPSNVVETLEMNKTEKIVSKSSQKIQENGDSQCKLLGSKKSKYSEKKFACPLCSFRALWKSRLDQHMAMHSDRKPYKCGQCSYTSFWRYNLKKHKLNKHPTKEVKTLKISPYVCSNCNFQTRFRSHFSQHMFNSTVVKSYYCFHCDHKFAKLNNLIFHIRKLHKTEKILPDQASNVCCYNNSRKCLVEKSFACPLCKYETEFRYRLARHLIIHSRKILLKCSRCSYATLQNDSLNEHVQQKHSQKEILPKENELTERSLKVIQSEKNNNSEKKPLIGCSRKEILKKCQPNKIKTAFV